MRKMVVVCLVLALACGFATAAGAQKGIQSVPVGGYAPKVTVTGEVIDTYCYSTAGARGMGHRECAMDCAKHGIPVGLLEKGTNQVYVLLPDKKATPIPAGVIDKCGEEITVTGQKYLTGGETFLTVESFK